MSMNVLFFPNGVTAVFSGNEQVIELQQHPWLLLWLEMAESKGYDATGFDITLPDGRKAQVFRTADGRVNWKVE